MASDFGDDFAKQLDDWFQLWMRGRLQSLGQVMRERSKGYMNSGMSYTDANSRAEQEVLDEFIKEDDVFETFADEASARRFQRETLGANGIHSVFEKQRISADGDVGGGQSEWNYIVRFKQSDVVAQFRFKNDQSYDHWLKKELGACNRYSDNIRNKQRAAEAASNDIPVEEKSTEVPDQNDPRTIKSHDSADINATTTVVDVGHTGSTDSTDLDPDTLQVETWQIEMKDKIEQIYNSNTVITRDNFNEECLKNEILCISDKETGEIVFTDMTDDLMFIPAEAIGEKFLAKNLTKEFELREERCLSNSIQQPEIDGLEQDELIEEQIGDVYLNRPSERLERAARELEQKQLERDTMEREVLETELGTEVDIYESEIRITLDDGKTFRGGYSDVTEEYSDYIRTRPNSFIKNEELLGTKYVGKITVPKGEDMPIDTQHLIYHWDGKTPSAQEVDHIIEGIATRYALEPEVCRQLLEVASNPKNIDAFTTLLNENQNLKEILSTFGEQGNINNVIDALGGQENIGNLLNAVSGQIGTDFSIPGNEPATAFLKNYIAQAPFLREPLMLNHVESTIEKFDIASNLLTPETLLKKPKGIYQGWQESRRVIGDMFPLNKSVKEMLSASGLLQDRGIEEISRAVLQH